MPVVELQAGQLVGRRFLIVLKRPLQTVKVLTGLVPDRCSSSTECWKSQQGQTRHPLRSEEVYRQITTPCSSGGETWMAWSYGENGCTPGFILLLLTSAISREGAQDPKLMSISFVVCGAGDVIDLWGRPAWFSARGL